MGAFYDLSHDIVLNVFNMVGQFVIWNLDLIVSRLRVFPGVALRKSFALRQGKVFLGNGFVVCEGREFGREELPVFIYSAFLINIRHLIHMFQDARYKFQVFVFGVLLVEDAVGFVA